MRKSAAVILMELAVMTVLLISCFPALGEPVTYDELGITADLESILDRSENYITFHNYGILQRNPVVAAASVRYHLLPREWVRETEAHMEEMTPEEQEKLRRDISSKSCFISSVLVTNAGSLEAAVEALGGQSESTFGTVELGSVDGYRFFCSSVPYEVFLGIYDDMAGGRENSEEALREKEKAAAEVRKVNEEFVNALKGAKLFAPVDPYGGLTGRVISFVSEDLDGNPVSSAELFAKNRITMVNIWGTWCVNCMDEMEELAAIHRRIQEKGCGIVGIEKEKEDIADVAEEARAVLREKGISYPNVLYPDTDILYGKLNAYPMTLFVDREGRILTSPIVGAQVTEYERVLDLLLAGGDADVKREAASTVNEDGETRVIVYDQDGNPVKGVFVSVCDDMTCSFQKTDENGIATFRLDRKVYEVHVQKVPEGYEKDTETYRTLESGSDVNIFLEKTR